MLKTSAVFATPWTVGALGSGGGLYALLSENENHSKRDINEEFEKLLKSEELKKQLTEEINGLDEEIDSLKKTSTKQQTNINVWNDTQDDQWSKDISEILGSAAYSGNKIISWSNGSISDQLKTEINNDFQEIEKHKNDTSSYLKDLVDKERIKDPSIENKSGIEETIVEKIKSLKNKEADVQRMIEKIKELEKTLQSTISSNEETKNSRQTKKDQLEAQKQKIGKESILTDKTTESNTNHQEGEISNLEEEMIQSKREIQEQINDLYSLYSSVLNSSHKKMDFSKVKIKNNCFVSKKNSEATFSYTSKEGKTTQFTVKKDGNLFKIEDFVSKSKSTGFSFYAQEIHLKTWNKTFNLKLFNNHHEKETPFETATISLESIFLVENVSKKENLGEILKQSVRVLLAIEAIKSRHLEKNGEKFEMKKNNVIPNSLVQRNFWLKGVPEIWNLEVVGFESKEEFIKYWILKTIELLTTKKVDFTDILEPFYKRNSYQQN